LPTKLERSPRPTISVVDKITLDDDDSSDDVVKIESGEELQSRAFPVAKTSPKRTFPVSLIPDILNGNILKSVPDVNAILDLSVPKRQRSRNSSAQREDIPSPHIDSIKSSSSHSSEISSVSDPNMALAADALALLKHAKATESNWSAVPVLQGLSLTNASQTFETGENFLEEANQW